MTWTDGLRAMCMDLGPLRESRDFRLLFLAGTVFYLGGMTACVAVPFQVYELTGSNFMVGAIGLVELVPRVVFGLYGGVLADHVDRGACWSWPGWSRPVWPAVLSVNGFADRPRIWVALLLMCAGAADMISAVFRTTVWNHPRLDARPAGIGCSPTASARWAGRCAPASSPTRGASGVRSPAAASPRSAACCSPRRCCGTS